MSEKLNISVSPDYSSSGLWEDGVDVALEDYDLPRDLIDDFDKWQEKYDKHLRDPNALGDDFDEIGLDLARRVKKELRERAIVKYENGVSAEIKLFYVDYNARLAQGAFGVADEDGDFIDLYLILKKFGLTNRYDEIWGDMREWLYTDVKDYLADELLGFDERGERLAEKLEEILPLDCVVIYKPLSPKNTFKKASLDGKTPILEWVRQNIEDGILPQSAQENLADYENFAQEFGDNLKQIKLAPGMMDSGIQGLGKGSGKAKELVEMILNAKEIAGDDYAISYSNLNEIEKYLSKNPIVDYSYDLVELISKIHEIKLKALLVAVGERFLLTSPHKESVKFGICTSFFYKKEGDKRDALLSLGLADEFSKYVADSFAISKQNDEVFRLAKVTDGYGQCNYIHVLRPENNDIKAWLIYEGYKNSLGSEHIAFVCASSGDLLWHINNGWNETLYDAAGELICGILGDHFSRAGEFENLGQIIELFIRRSEIEDMNIDRFDRICDIFDFVKDDEEEILGFSEEQKDLVRNVASDIAFERGYDWEAIISANLELSKARRIARKIGFDIWDMVYEIAKKDAPNWCWDEIARTKDKERFRKVCALAEEKLNLSLVGSGMGDEYGFGEGFETYISLVTIIQNMRGFDEIIGLNLIKVALNSPITGLRNMALNIVKLWREVPSEMEQIIRRNLKIEPNEEARKKCEEILSNLN